MTANSETSGVDFYNNMNKIRSVSVDGSRKYKITNELASVCCDFHFSNLKNIFFHLFAGLRIISHKHFTPEKQNAPVVL